MKASDQKILVTGVAGFIGWKTAEKLLAHGYRVIGIDNMNDYYDVRLKTWRLARLKQLPGFEFFKIDIENYNLLHGLFEQHAPPFDAVINLAARAGVRYSLENPFVYYTTNVLGNLNLLQLCREFQIKKYILASTSSLYAGQKMPFKEDLPVNEPISPYAASKKAAEVTCYTYHRLFGIDATVLRYFTVYGPAGRPDMSPFRFITWVAEEKPVIIYGDGNQSRDFTFVDDIASGTIAALRLEGFEIINLGGDQPYKLIDFLHIIEEKLGKEAKIMYEPFHPADMIATWADITKAKNRLGWQPRTTVENGVELAIKWFVENRQLAASIP